MQQLDLFKREENFYVLQQLDKVTQSSDKQRKAFFSMFSEVYDKILNLQEQIEDLKHNEKVMQ